MTRQLVTHKSKFWAVFWCLCLGAIGFHRFYLGHKLIGFMWIIISLLSLAVGAPMVVTALLVADAVYLLCKGKGYYRRAKVVEFSRVV